MKKIKNITFLFIIVVVLIIGVLCRKVSPLESEFENTHTAQFSTLTSLEVSPHDWVSYGHDAQATSASDGLISQLVFAWEHNTILPEHTSTYAAGSGNMVATPYYIWHKIDLYSPYFITSGINIGSWLYKIDNTGNRKWITRQVSAFFPTAADTSGNIGVNASEHTFIGLSNNVIMTNDDAIDLRNANNGDPISRMSYDLFGSVTPYNGSFIYTKIAHYDYDQSQLELNFNKFTKYYSRIRRDVNDGHAVVDNGVVFYQPNYNGGSWVNGVYIISNDTLYSGLHAYDYSTGNEIYWKKIQSNGRMSAANSKLFLTENSNIVCRNQSNGEIVWSKPLTNLIINQPPVLVGNIVIIATNNNILAFDQLTGQELWNTPIPNLGFQYSSDNSENTVLAAAKGSQTLVATSENGIHLLNYNNGLQIQFLPSTLSINLRYTNPIIVEGALYVNSTEKNHNSTGNTLKIICFRDINYIPPVIDTISPTIQITNPISFSSINGTLNITANASDNIGITNVNFYINNTLLESVATAPYLTPLNTLNYTDGNYTLTAKAYDVENNVGISSVSVNINNGPDLTAPVVTIYSPANGSKLPSVKGKKATYSTISIGATDDRGVISKYQILIDGIVVSNTNLFSWQINSVSSGNHTITGKAWDGSNNVGVKQITVIK